MIVNIYDFLACMDKLMYSPETDWEFLLGQEAHVLLEPEFSNFKTVKNVWNFNPQWGLMFNILASIYFTDEDLLASFNKAIKNISELKL